jgi:two-component system response regulator YesN
MKAMYKVLIVDDEFIERNALKYVITNNCPRITSIEEANNGRKAIQIAGVFKPDIILMDIKMPGINGIEATKAIKQFAPGCKIVLLTAFDYFDYAREAIHIGVEDFIIKPAANEQVIGIVNKIIDSLHSERNSQARQIEIENKLGQVTRYLEHELVSSIINGDMDEAQTIDYFSVMDIEFYKGFALYIKLDFNKSHMPLSSKYQKDMIKKRYMDKFKAEIEKRDFIFLSTYTGNNIYSLALCQSNNSDHCEGQELTGFIKKIYEELHQQIDISITIGIGGVVDNPGSLYSSFLQARSACSNNENAENGVHFESMEQRITMTSYPIEKEDKLCDCLIACDENQSILLIEEITGWMGRNFDTLEEIRWKMSELLIMLFRISEREFRLSTKDLKASFNEMLHMESILELKNYLIHEVRSIIKEINSIKTDRSAILIDKVCEFIRQNYTREISLDEAAGMVGLSNFYFSKVFKLYKKMNFIDFVTEVRIKKAKELLKNPIINIKDIGGFVGYYDPNYFTRVFKKIEGITPTEFRSKKVLL